MGFFLQVYAVFVSKARDSLRNVRFLVLSVLLPLIFLGALLAVYHSGANDVGDLSGFTARTQMGLGNFGQDAIVPFSGDGKAILDQTHQTKYFPHFLACESPSAIDALILHQKQSVPFRHGYEFHANGSATMLYSSLEFGGLASTLQVYAQSLYRLLTKNASATLGLVGHAFPSDNASPLPDLFQFYGPFLIEFGCLMLLGSLAILQVEYRAKGNKSLVELNGGNRASYWLGTLLGDIGYHLAVMLVIFLVLVLGKVAPLSQHAGLMSLLLVIYGVFSPVYAYIISLIFDQEETAQKWAPSMLLMGATVLYAPITVLSLMGHPEAARVLGVATSVIFPPQSLQMGLASLAQASSDPGIRNVFWDTQFGMAVVAMVAQGVFFGALLLALDRVKSKGLCRCKRADWQSCPEAEQLDADEMVENERYRDSAGAVLRALDVRKAFPAFRKETTFAVHGVSLTMEQGTFCLLGANGAGKTTLMRLLIGEIPADSGELTLVDTGDLGYAPQSESLWQRLTPQELFRMIARIRAVPQVERAVQEMLSRLMLAEYAGKQIHTLSGGNRRKCAVGCAILGAPRVIFLDEPSAGVSVDARHMIWEVVERLKADHVILLTTHVMEEAEALADRIAIMFSGRFVCLDSPTALKAKYATGYRLRVVPVDPSMADEIALQIEDAFPGCTRQSLTVFLIPMSFKMSQIFEWGERAKTENLLLDFTAAIGSLESVFARFATLQAIEESNELKKL